MFSAIKRDGKPLYALARKGEEIEVPERVVHVETLRLMDETERHGFMLQIHCGRGTYVRSICNDLGELVGCPAHMRFLLRSQSGFFTLDNAMTLEEAEAAAKAGVLRQRLIALDAPIQHMPRADVPERLLPRVANGCKLFLKPLSLSTPLSEGDAVRVYCANRFWGIAALTGDHLSWKALIPPEE